MVIIDNSFLSHVSQQLYGVISHVSLIFFFSLTVFPAVFSSEFIQHEIVGEYSHLFTVQGSAPGLLPYMLLAHMDVVPAPPQGWHFPPFSAAEHQGFIYGRGTLDNKNSAIVSVLGDVFPQGHQSILEFTGLCHPLAFMRSS